MQLSYRGRHYTSIPSEVPTTHQSFKGQFLGIPSTLATAYRSDTPNVTVPLTYRGQSYQGDR